MTYIFTGMERKILTVTMEPAVYLPPVVEVVSVAVERGYAGSMGGEDWEDGGEEEIIF